MAAFTGIDALEHDIQLVHDSIDNAGGSHALYMLREQEKFAAAAGYTLHQGYQKRAKLTIPRWSVSRDDLVKLESIFTEVRTPSLALRQQLAREMNVTPRQVQVWFRNRRQRVRLAALGQTPYERPLDKYPPAHTPNFRPLGPDKPMIAAAPGMVMPPLACAYPNLYMPNVNVTGAVAAVATAPPLKTVGFPMDADRIGHLPGAVEAPASPRASSSTSSDDDDDADDDAPPPKPNDGSEPASTATLDALDAPPSAAPAPCAGADAVTSSGLASRASSLGAPVAPAHGLFGGAPTIYPKPLAPCGVSSELSQPGGRPLHSQLTDVSAAAAFAAAPADSIPTANFNDAATGHPAGLASSLGDLRKLHAAAAMETAYAGCNPSVPPSLAYATHLANAARLAGQQATAPVAPPISTATQGNTPYFPPPTVRFKPNPPSGNQLFGAADMGLPQMRGGGGTAPYAADPSNQTCRVVGLSQWLELTRSQLARHQALETAALHAQHQHQQRRVLEHLFGSAGVQQPDNPTLSGSLSGALSGSLSMPLAGLTAPPMPCGSLASSLASASTSVPLSSLRDLPPAPPMPGHGETLPRLSSLLPPGMLGGAQRETPRAALPPAHVPKEFSTASSTSTVTLDLEPADLTKLFRDHPSGDLSKDLLGCCGAAAPTGVAGHAAGHHASGDFGGLDLKKSVSGDLCGLDFFDELFTETFDGKGFAPADRMAIN